MPLNQKKKPLSFRQQRAAKLLSVGWLRDSQVAKLMNVRRETIWAWRRQPRFQTELAELEREFSERIAYRQRALLDPVLTALERIVDASDVRASLAAAKMV